MDYKEVEKKWEATKRYFQDHKRFTRPFSVNLGAAIRGFDIDNIAAQQAIDESKALHARRWQTKEGTYRIKKHVLPDVRDGRDVSEDAGASTSDNVDYSGLGWRLSHGSLTSFGVLLDMWYQYTTWGSSTCECFGCFPFSPASRTSHPTLWRLPWSLVWGFVWLVCVLVLFVFPLFGLFCKC